MFIVGSQFFDAATLPLGATPDIIVDGFDGSNVDQNVFVNQNGIAVGNGNIENNEYVTMEFTQDQTEVIFTFGRLRANQSFTLVISTPGGGSITRTVQGSDPTLTVSASDFKDPGGTPLQEFNSLKMTNFAGDTVTIGSITFNSRIVITDATYNFQVAITDG